MEWTADGYTLIYNYLGFHQRVNQNKCHFVESADEQIEKKIDIERYCVYPFKPASLNAYSNSNVLNLIIKLLCVVLGSEKINFFYFNCSNSKPHFVKVYDRISWAHVVRIWETETEAQINFVVCWLFWLLFWVWNKFEINFSYCAGAPIADWANLLFGEIERGTHTYIPSELHKQTRQLQISTFAYAAVSRPPH